MTKRSQARTLLAWIRRITPLRISLAIALTFALLHITIESESFSEGFLSKNGIVHLLDLKALDQKFASQRRKQGNAIEPHVVIAAVDEKSVDAYGLWPWNRRIIADFIRAADTAGARVIAFDAVFSDADKNSMSSGIERAISRYETSLQQDRPQDAAQTSQILQRLRTELVKDSPDAELARAIAEHERTVLGYFNFYNAKEIVGLPKNELARDFKAIEKSKITSVFDEIDEEFDGHAITRWQASNHTKINNLEIRTIVAPQSPLQELADAASHFGYFNVPPDRDGIMRRIRLFSKHQDQLYPALSLLATSVYFDTPIRPLAGTIRLGKSLDGVAPLNPASGEKVPLDMQGRLLINYYDAPERYIPTYSVTDIITGNIPKAALQDKVVLFGLTAIGLDTDLVPTPFAPNTPGVFVHAAVIQNMIDGRYLQRFFGIALIEALGYLLLGGLLGLLIPRLPASLGILATALFAVGLYVIDIAYIFPQGVWILNVLPMLQAVGTLSAINAHGYLTEGREKRKIRQAFQFYLTKSVVDEVLKDTSKLKLGGERRTCTVLFSDVRGFTEISERLSPEALVALLNEYLTPMTNLVFRYDGTLDKYIGDAIMAIFGAPVAYADHPTRACFCALDMMQALTELRPEWQARGLPDIDIGIGLNTGPMAVGNMGSDIRFDYTVMGDHVNLGSRLEGLNKNYDSHIIISEYTYLAAQNDIHARLLDSVRVKGKLEPVRIYELLGRGQPSPSTQTWLEAWNNAVTFYQAQRWDDALAAFTAVQELKTDDAAARVYIKRCQTMRAEPPGPAWDGVYTMTTK